MREESGASVRRRLSKEERRELILDAATQVIADRGYEGASLDEIADAAGISKPVIYDHFASKKALLLSLLESHSEEMLAFLVERVGAERTPERQLAAGLGAFFEFIEEHPHHAPLILRDVSATDPDVLQAYEGTYRRMVDGLAALIGTQPAGRRLGDPLELSEAAEVTARVFMDACKAVETWWQDHREVPRQTVVEVLMGLLWVGIERMQAGERWRAPAGQEPSSSA
jgi:AcrR family transcriptional regulator